MTKWISRRRPLRWLAFGSVVMALLFLVISCATVTRPVVVLPEVANATYIGSKECEQCHDKLYKGFITADHSRLIAEGTNALNAGCESCHGPCSAHSESGGEILPPYTFTSGRPSSGSFGARVATRPPRATETVCFQCHADVRGQFSLPTHHPVTEAKLGCTDCHSPHTGDIHAGGGTSLLSENESCARCHTAQRGPFVFAHEAMHEQCTVCHAPHGSVNAKLLTERNANLCLKCHFQQATGGRLLIGGSDHTLRLQQGTCWTAGCHEAVHGSRVSPSLRF
ncbi:MAG TPA: cytochrome c3 family protein [Verrucomicrobiae bacterium]|nr:cytochrome c3 family protein [Verrucomicrobiae bacterium]